MPSWFAPVAAPSVKPGDDARSVLARCYVALDTANGRLTDGRAWGEQQRKAYGGQGG